MRFKTWKQMRIRIAAIIIGFLIVYAAMPGQQDEMTRMQVNWVRVDRGELLRRCGDSSGCVVRRGMVCAVWTADTLPLRVVAEILATCFTRNR